MTDVGPDPYHRVGEQHRGQGPAGGGHTDDRTQSRAPLGDGFAGNLAHIGSQATQQLRNSAQQATDAQLAMQRAQQEHLQELVATHEKMGTVIDKVAPPSYASYPFNSPAITVNLVLGVILGLLTLFKIPLSPDQLNALNPVVAGLFVIVPVAAGALIKFINSQRSGIGGGA